MKKRILSILTALALTIALLPAMGMPASAAGTTRPVSTSEEFHAALAAAQDGDTIQVNGSFVVKNPKSNNDSLVIDKAVTIQGGSLTFWYAGILLGADVTFQGITLGLGSNARPAIMANGHTLTLENVQRDPTCRNINLFCGGQTGGTQGALAATKQGSHGQIIIKGNTNLGPTGRIFAGSISTDGNGNVFDKPATVTIDPSVTGDPIGELYACGALETYTSENDWFNYKEEINPPFASPGNFKVSGNVTFNLYQGKVGKVSGDTGVEGNLAQVKYSGTDYLNDSLILSKIGGLTVESGNLAPVAGQLVQENENTADRTSKIVSVPGSSCFNSVNAPLTITSGAILGLQNLGDVTVGNFTGGGTLVLGQAQKLTVTGAVSGTTTVGVGSVFNGHSLKVPTVGYTYINAASSSTNSFTLAAPASRPDIKLVNSGSGAWTAEADEEVIVVNDFKLASAVVEVSSGPDVELPVLDFTDVQATPEDKYMPLSSIKLAISVNDIGATVTDDGSSYTYTTSTLDLYVTEGYTATEALTVEGTNNTYPPVGTYVISVTVPASNSGTGQSITRTATLVVRAAGDTGPTAIPLPTANAGLVYNGQEQVGVPEGPGYTLSGESATEAGQHTATATLKSGFEWTGGGSDAKTINWGIAKARKSNLPTGLGTAAPTTYGGRDGKITGTTAEMEYSTDAQFAMSVGTQCTANETTGLQAGDYYVRIAGSKNYEAGPAVMVTVPQGPITVTRIEVSSTGHKTAYKTGEALDVTGLTLTVTMSNNSTYLVPVAAGMVSGFNSSVTGSQTLTITYSGQIVTYNINIAADPNPVTSIAITSTDHKTQYTVRELLDVTGLKLTVTRQNGPVEVIDVLPNMVTGFNSGNPIASQTLTITYGGQTATYNISIAEASSGGDSGDSGNTGGGSTGGGSTGGGSTGGGSSNTTTNPDGSVTTTVTDEKTGTVTTTTRKPDGSTTVVEAKKDGTVTVTDTAKNGVKVEAVSKPEADTSARVTLPAGVKTAAVTVPVAVTPGMVAVDAKTGKIVKLSAPTGAGMLVRLDGSADLILVDRSKPFTDTSGHWAESAIDFTTAHAMFNGTSDTTFAPDDAMTRGMIAVVLHNFEGNPELGGQNSFADVESGAWYVGGIGWMIEKGITSGYGDGRFGTNDAVTREQLVTFLYRYAGSMGYNTGSSADLSAFSDGDSVSGYAAEAMRWAVGSGLILGTDDGVLSPGGSATRAQVASILNRFVLNLMK